MRIHATLGQIALQPSIFPVSQILSTKLDQGSERPLRPAIFSNGESPKHSAKQPGKCRPCGIFGLHYLTVLIAFESRMARFV